MNCRKGDVAVVASKHHKVEFLTGRVVKVLSRLYLDYQEIVPGSTRVWWLCEGNFADTLQFKSRSPRESETRMELPDAWLVPLRDPGDSATDEMLLLVGSPNWQEA